MLRDVVRDLPQEAFTRGIKRLHQGGLVKNVLILGFDCEYDSLTQEIVSYQLSDGVKSVLWPATKNWTWKELGEHVLAQCKEWGHGMRDYNTIALISHFSTAELSHIEQFHVDAEVRRVSPQQVFNASYRISHRHNLVVVDQYHFWNTSLAKVAEVWGEEKLEYDTAHVTRKSLDDPKFREYAVWDAVVCQRTFTKFRDRAFRDYAVDILRFVTPASFAMAVYRLHYMDDDYERPVARVRKAAWRSLWGGRAEAYAMGDFFGDYTLRDVKSLYPSSAILLDKFPRAEDWVERMGGKPVTWKGLCSVSFAFPDSVKYPCLPVSHRGKLIFPSRGFSDCTLDEVKVAISLGCKVKFQRIFEYTGGTPTLSAFMVEMMRKKDTAEEEGDQPGRDLAKLLMNSLIGKFSQNRGEPDLEDWKEFSVAVGLPLEVVMAPGYQHPDKPAGKHRIGAYIMPEWSALILGKARSVMASLLNSGIESLICSTDSLLIPAAQNATVDTMMAAIGVRLDSKNGHCAKCCEERGLKCAKKCKRTAPTAHVRVVRNRVYAAECTHGEPLFMANHGIHLKRGDAFRLIMGEGDRYLRTRRLGLKTAVRTGKAFFGEEKSPMTFKGTWDNKRRLLMGGVTAPWRDTAECDSVVDALSTKKSSSPKASLSLPARERRKSAQ